jgi:hypothetical protein
MRPTPLAEVKKSFENKAKLVDQLAGIVDKTRGDTTNEQVRSRLMGLPNSKLLRLWKVEQKVREKFGDRDKLVAFIVSERKKAGVTADASFVAKLETFTKARLLDMAAQRHGTRPAKQTAEQKLRRKRGRKAKERAQSAIAKKK